MKKIKPKQLKKYQWDKKQINVLKITDLDADEKRHYKKILGGKNKTKRKSLLDPQGDNKAVDRLKKALLLSMEKKKKPTSGKGRWVTIRGRKVFLKPGEKATFGKKPKFSAKEVDEAVSSYQLASYHQMNKYLRGKQDTLQIRKKQYIDIMDSAIEQNGNWNKTPLYRGTSKTMSKQLFSKCSVFKDTKGFNKLSEKGKCNYIAKKLVGTIIQDKGFFSSSSEHKQSTDFITKGGNKPTKKFNLETLIKGIPVRFTVTKYAGKILDVNKVLENSRYGAEKEIILPRGLSFKIKSVSVTKHKTFGYILELGGGTNEK